MTFSILGQTMTIGVKLEWATARIEGLPIGGKVIRRCFRPKQVGVAFVKVGSEMRKYYLGITETGLKLQGLCGINRKEPT
jgi:hypothetical protein